MQTRKVAIRLGLCAAIVAGSVAVLSSNRFQQSSVGQDLDRIVAKWSDHLSRPMPPAACTSLFDIEYLCAKEVTLDPSEIAARGNYSPRFTHEEQNLLTLVDIDLKKKLVLKTNAETTFIEDSPNVFLRTKKGDIVFNMRDYSVSFYHPNAHLLVLNANHAVLYETEEEQLGEYCIYDMHSQRKSHFWKGVKEADNNPFSRTFPEVHISSNGVFVAKEHRYHDLEMGTPSPGGSWATGLHVAMVENEVDIYNHKTGKTSKVFVSRHLDRAVPVLSLADDGSLVTAIGNVTYTGINDPDYR